MFASLELLLIEDDEDDYFLTREMLLEAKGQRYCLDWAASYQEACSYLSSKSYDAVLVDFDLGAKNGIQLIQESISSGIEAPFIMVTGRGSYEKDVEAMQAGASDYLTKEELSAPLLERSIRYAIERSRIEEELERRVQERTSELQVTIIEELQVMDEELQTQISELQEFRNLTDAENDHYKDLFEFAPSAYLVTDHFGVILEANIPAQEMLNCQKEFLVGKPLAVFVAPEHKSIFRNQLNSLYKTKKSREWNLLIIPDHQEPVDAHLVAAPIWGRDPDNLLAVRWLIFP